MTVRIAGRLLFWRLHGSHQLGQADGKQVSFLSIYGFGGRLTVSHNVQRFADLCTLTGLALGAGLTVAHVFGDRDRNMFTHESPETIMTLRAT